MKRVLYIDKIRAALPRSSCLIYGLRKIGLSTILADVAKDLKDIYRVQVIDGAKNSHLSEAIEKLELTTKTLLIIDDIDKYADYKEVLKTLQRHEVRYLAATHQKDEIINASYINGYITLIEIPVYSYREFRILYPDLPDFDTLGKYLAIGGIPKAVSLKTAKERGAFFDELIDEIFKKDVIKEEGEYEEYLRVYRHVLEYSVSNFINSGCTPNSDYFKKVRVLEKAGLLYRSTDDYSLGVHIYERYYPVDLGLAQHLLNKEFALKPALLTSLFYDLNERGYKTTFGYQSHVESIDLIGYKDEKRICINVEPIINTKSDVLSASYSLAVVKGSSVEKYLVSLSKDEYPLNKIKTVSILDFLLR